MIIKHVADAVSPETNTDKLPDVEAMILEKAEELRKLCFDTNRQCAIVVDAKGSEEGNGFQFWNMKMKSKEMAEVKDGEKIKNDSEEINRAYTNLLSMVHQFVTTLTQGQIGVVSIKNYNDMVKTVAAYHQEVERLKEKLSGHGFGDEQ